MKAQIVLNDRTGKYELVFNGKVLIRSKTPNYLAMLVERQYHRKIIKNQITTVEMVNPPVVTSLTTIKPMMELVPSVKPEFTINERFSFMEQLIMMVINKTAKSLLITGEGGIGKTHTVLDVLKRAGKIDSAEIISSSLEKLGTQINVDDDDETITAKIDKGTDLSLSNGDYVIIKGHSSAKAVYRTMYENRNGIIIFDDCDVLKDAGAVGLLKSALDSYETRWVHWRTEQLGESDLPQCFKFDGTIIFITNMKMEKIDEAVKTRCFKVDLSMTKPQRIERMRSVIDNIMPGICVEDKTDALDFLEENLDATDDINFRTLMNLVSIRVDPSVTDWKRLGRYALTEN